MTDERIDEVEVHYRPVEYAGVFSSVLFWACAAMSIAILYGDMLGSRASEVLSVLFVVAVVFYFCASEVNSSVLMPRAERKRRKQLLSDAFATHLTPEETRNYYNNELPPSIGRLAASVLENTHFGKAVCSRMARTERIRLVGYFTVWLLAITYRETDLALIAAITQFLFSGEIVARAVRLELLRARLSKTYDDLYALFLHRVSHQENPGMAGILDAFASYESAKAAGGIKQSSRIFNEMNAELSGSWDRVREKLRLDEIDRD